MYNIGNISWNVEEENTTKLLSQNGAIFKAIHNIASMVGNLSADIPNIAAFFQMAQGNGSTSAKGSVLEMARYFHYDLENCDETQVTFTLFNTIAKDGRVDHWKRNLYFITLFALRNLPFRLDSTTYLPPLLYDVIIPGVKRLPFSYVSSFSVQPYGLTRTMKIDNFLSGIAGSKNSNNTTLSIPIPEAWGITINFKSMLARSANLYLAGSMDLPITTGEAGTAGEVNYAAEAQITTSQNEPSATDLRESGNNALRQTIQTESDAATIERAKARAVKQFYAGDTNADEMNYDDALSGLYAGINGISAEDKARLERLYNIELEKLNQQKGAQ